MKRSVKHIYQRKTSLQIEKVIQVLLLHKYAKTLADLTGPSGTYLIASTVSGFTASAMDIYKLDVATGTGTIAAPNQAATLNLHVVKIPPRVLSVYPMNGELNVLPSSSIVLNFSKALDQTTVTASNIALTDPSGTALTGVFSASTDATTVTFYPSALMNSQTKYSLFISKAIKDLQGYVLGQDVTSTFTTKNMIPPPMPPAGSITASFPDANGYITVTSTQGSVEPNCTVLIINDTSGEIATVMSQTNGSFTGTIRAMLGDEVKIMIMDASGNQTLVSYITFKSADGKYLVTAKGGSVVDDASGAQLDIPEGALPSPTVIKITPVLEASLSQQVPQGGRFLAAVNIDTGGVTFQKEINLSVPAPSGVTTENMPFLAQPTQLTNANGTVENVYSIQDSAKVINGRLTTASPPFDWKGGFGTFVFVFPTFEPVVISGFTYRDMDGKGGYNPQTDASGNYLKNSDRPVKDAIVRSPAASQYISLSNDSGHYATYGFTTVDISANCRPFTVTAINPQTMFQSTLGPLQVCTEAAIQFDFKLADAATQIRDTTAPSITLNLQVAPNSDQDANHQDMKFVAGTIPVGTNISVPIGIIDQEISKVTLSVSYQTPDMTAAQQYFPQLSPTESHIYTYTGTDSSVAIMEYTYGAIFTDPTTSQSSVYFKPGASGVYSFQVEATDASNNASTKSVQVRAVPAGTQLQGIDGPPTVDEIVPSDGATNVMVTMPITVTFSEPVNISTVNGNTIQLFDLSTTAPTPVPASIYTDTSGGMMQAVLVPNNNLVFGRNYQVVVTQGITDDIGNSQSVCQAQTPPQAAGCFLPLDKAYSAIFRTKDPEVYDLQGDNFTGGRDIALYTDAKGNTYSYVAAGDQGWYVVNVTDPTNPYIVNKENWTSGSNIFQYRGIAVDQQTGTLGITIWHQDLTNYNNSAGDVHFYSLADTPDKPSPKGQDVIAQGNSGVPDKIAISGNYAFVTTLMVGLQVIDITKVTPPAYGGSIVGVLSTVDLAQCQQPDTGVTGNCGNPSDLALYKSNRLLIPTSSGHLLTVDVSQPMQPQLLSAYKPANFSAFRVGVAESYPYTLPGAGSTQVMDLAVVGSQVDKSRIYTVDVTDPYGPVLLGVVKDSNGSEVQIVATEIAVSKNSGLAYATAGTSVYVIDIKDPNNPLLLNVIAQAPNASGALTSLQTSIGLVEKDGWVYLANQQNGMRALDLDPIVIQIEEGDPSFPNVKIPSRDYYPILGTKSVRILGTISGEALNSNNIAEWGLYLVDKGNSAVTIGNMVNGQCQGDFSAGQLVDHFIPYNNVVDHNAAVMVCFTYKGSLDDTKDQFISPVFQAKKNGAMQLSEATASKPYPVQFHIRQNGNANGINTANVSLTEVLAGTAVFLADGLTSTSTDTTGLVTDKLGFDYVQELLNQVIPRARTTFDVASNKWVNNAYQLISENGVYSDETYSAVQTFKRSFKIEPNSTIIAKLIKDYGLSTQDNSGKYWEYKIVDQAMLIGKTLQSTDTVPNSYPNSPGDTGLYELYTNVVEPFVNKMLDEAKLYAGERQPDLTQREQPVTDNWVSRNNYGSSVCTGPTPTTCVGPHGPGMSYSWDGKMNIAGFNAQVSPTCRKASEGKITAVVDALTSISLAKPAIPTSPSQSVPGPTVVSMDYKGDLDVSCNTGAIGGLKYPGLKEHESNSATIQHVMTIYSTFSQATFTLPQYSSQFWAGIDCSGLVQRSINRADSLQISGAQSNVPTLGDTGSGAVWSQNLVVSCSRCVSTYTYQIAYDAQHESDSLANVRKGDLVGYQHHISIVYSDPTRNADDENETTTRSYEIIHAYGLDSYTDEDNIDHFMRKVVLMPNQIIYSENKKLMPEPTGFGRIMLWD